MRLLPLIGLISLTGLAVASPVISREAGEDGSVTPPRRLVVYTELNFTGTPYEIHAEKDCVQLVAPVYKNMKSFKVADQVCYFMDEDACGGKALVIVDALGAEAWGNTDDSTNFSTRITSVYCEDHSMRPPGTDTAVVKRDGPGETTVCRSTMNIGPCVTLSANNACVYFGYELRHNIRNVYQAYGSICNYYDDDNCNVPTPVMTVNTHKQALHVQLDRQTGDRLAYVKCQDYWSAADTQRDDVHIFPRADDVASIRQGELRACRLDGFCIDVNALHACQPMDHELSGEIHTLTQGPHSDCVFWRERDCSNKYFTTSSKSEELDLVGPGIRTGMDIVAVSCHANSPTDAVHGRSAAHHPIEKATDIVQTPFTATPCDDLRNMDPKFPTAPGFIYFCYGPGRSTNRGKNCNRSCTGANASNQCFRMTWPRPSLVDVLWQAPGTVCKYYRHDCLDKWPSLIIDTRTISITPQNFKGNGIFISTVACKSNWGTEELGAGPDTIVYNGTSVGPAQLKQETADIVSSTEETSLKIIDVIICSRKDLAGDCTHLSSDTCWLLPPKIARSAVSWSQSEHLACTFFAGPLCSDILWRVTTSSKQFTANTSTRISDLTVAIRCDPIGAAQSESEANTKVLPPAVKRETDTPLKIIDVSVCADPDVTGSCIQLNAELCWVMLPKSAVSIRQSENLVCTLWSTKDCTGNLWSLTTGFTYQAVNIPPEVTERTLTINCVSLDAPSASEASTELLPPAVRRETDASLKVDGILCTGENSTGQCPSVEASQCYILQGTYLGARSWRQSERLVCKFWAGTNCDRDEIWALTTDFSYKAVNLPLVVSRQGHSIRCVPLIAPEPGSAGQVLVADREGFGGKTQLVDTVKDNNNCAPLSEELSLNIRSLIQYQGSVCNYWTYECGNVLRDEKPIFTVDSLGGQIGLSPIPYAFGGKNRNKIGSISCINGKAAADYMAALDPSEKVIDIETPEVAKNTAFSTGPHDDQLAAGTESATDDYFEPLALYHDPDQGGAVMTYVGPSCGLNPFGVDPIKSLWQVKGFLCQFYPAWGCQETNGPPLWINSKDGPCYNRNVEFPILSISCTRSTYEDAIERPDTTQLIEHKAEATPAVLPSGTITPATLATRTDAANTFAPLKFCTGENLTGACFSYTGPACASGDPAIFEMKSLVVDKDFHCVFMSGLNCNEGYPHYVDARQDENRMNSINWIVKSIYCSRSRGTAEMVGGADEMWWKRKRDENLAED